MSTFSSDCPQIYGTRLRALVVVAFLLCIAGAVTAQPVMYRITFFDKGPDAFVPGSAAYEAALAEYSTKALDRRALHGKQPLLDTADQPLYAPYLQQLEAMGIHTMAPVRLRNCVIALMDTTMAAAVIQLPFVRSVQRTKERAYIKSADVRDCFPRRYDDSRTMHEIINTRPLHNAGVFGQGTVVGMIDNGFRDNEHSSLAHLDVRGRYDVVEDQPDVLDGHGTISLSIVASNAQDTLIGIAPFAAFLLARSEDQRFERKQEEDNLCAALEWIERSGADVASMSIGYRYFDEGEEPSITYADLEGNTTFASQAVNRAVSVGLVCVTAIGNNGPDTRTLLTPADADSVVAVGAVDRDQVLWTSSARGPAANGRIRPDVTALGVKVVAAGLGSERYIRADGTSTAAPQIAGAFALLKQLVPNARAYELRNALYATAQFPEVLDTASGHGIPDVTAAARRLGPCFGLPSVVVENNRWTLVIPMFSESGTTVDYTMRTRNGTSIAGIAVQRDTDWWTCALDSLNDANDTIEVRIHARDGVRQRTATFPSDSTWYVVTRRIAIACRAVLPSSITRVDEAGAGANASAPFMRSISAGIAITTTSRTIALPFTNVLSASIVDVMGTTRATIAHADGAITQADGALKKFDVPLLPSGWYIIVVRTSNRLHTIPIIITE